MGQKSVLGKRLICADCNTKYYDLNRKNPHCPKCGSTAVGAPKSKFRMPKQAEIDVEPEEAETMDLEMDDDLDILPVDNMDDEYID